MIHSDFPQVGPIISTSMNVIQGIYLLAKDINENEPDILGDVNTSLSSVSDSLSLSSPLKRVISHRSS